MLSVQAADGTDVRAETDGEGQVILILHPGMDTGRSYAQVAVRLARRYRVVRLHRRQYRLDLKSDPLRGSPCTIAEEVEHVLAITRAIGRPVLLFGHSSGATVALEALSVEPSLFVGMMLYEPACVIERTEGLYLAEDRIEHDGETGEGLQRARQALIEGRPGQALGVFTQLVTGWPRMLANLAGTLAALFPAYRQLIPCQIDDLEALERLGVRLDVCTKLNMPIAIVGGERSPDCLKAIVAEVAAVLPMVERITLRGQGHAGNRRNPKQLADVLETFATNVFQTTS